MKEMRVHIIKNHRIVFLNDIKEETSGKDKDVAKKKNDKLLTF